MTDRSETSQLIGPASRVYFSQRLRLHYVDWGNEDAPPLLMIHGGRDHCRNWDWTAQALRDRFHIIAPDLRGHGDSQWMVGSGYEMNDYVYDIAQLIHQKGLAPLTIIAHSMGGAIALRYTGLTRRTSRSSSSSRGSALAEDAQRAKAFPATSASATGSTKSAAFLAAAAPLRQHRGSLQADAGRELRIFARTGAAPTVHGVNQNEDGTYSWKFDNYVRAFSPAGFDEETSQKLWARITCPTLLIRGTESWASDPVADGRAKHFKNAEIVAVEGAGHWVQHDKLDEFLKLTEDFLGV